MNRETRRVSSFVPVLLQWKYPVLDMKLNPKPPPHPPNPIRTLQSSSPPKSPCCTNRLSARNSASSSGSCPPTAIAPTAAAPQYQGTATPPTYFKPGEAYVFVNCILRNGPRDNAHMYIGNLYMEPTNPQICWRVLLSKLHIWNVKVSFVHGTSEDLRSSCQGLNHYPSSIWYLVSISKSILPRTEPTVS